MFTTVEMVRKTYTAKDIRNMLTNNAPLSGNSNTMGQAANEKQAKLAIEFLRQFIRDNRFELFGNYNTFQIITNGYHELKEIFIPLDKQSLSAGNVFRSLQQFEDDGYTMPSMFI